MPGLTKRFDELFIEYFCLCYSSSSSQFDTLLHSSFYYSYVSTIIFRFNVANENDLSNFTVISSDMINFCNVEMKTIVQSLEISDTEKKITIFFYDSFEENDVMICLKKFWSKHP
jgi:hypothetical protein